MSDLRHSESAFETAIEAHLLAHGYVPVPSDGFDRERAIFPETALGFICETQPKEWARLEALLGEQTGAEILHDLCGWMDTHGAWRRSGMGQVLRQDPVCRVLQGGA